jgi:tRNA-splicing ligase RtcB
LLGSRGINDAGAGIFMHEPNDRVKTWLPPEQIEPAARAQIDNVSRMPFLFKHVAVMPDCHLGKGATVGTVIATRGAIIPAAVGVDVGCGMVAVRTKFFADQLPDELRSLREGIERRIPLGTGGANRKITKTAAPRISALRAAAQVDYSRFADWTAQLGSLGSGNHFVEVSVDEIGQVWLVLHSGSRGVGNRVADSHIKTAQRLMRAAGVELPDRDLAYHSEDPPEFDAYMRDLTWAQEYARLNREEMMDRVLTEVSYAFYGEDGHQQEIELQRINCHHNFTQRENHFGHNVWITRKGAIQMQEGQKGVIPGSMGTRSYIVSGLGNPQAFHSAPHGAGRRFSRNEARRRFSMADFDAAMKGIECRHSAQLIDELPMAYKDIDEVIENSKDLVRVEHVLRQVVNVKGD